MQYYKEDNDADGFYNSSSYEISRVLNQGSAKGSSRGQVDAEYVYEQNGNSSKSVIKDGGYLLPPHDANNSISIQQNILQPHNKRKPTASDVYDEDHYTLARNSGFGSDFTDGSKHGKTKREKKKKLLTSKTIITISVIIGIFAIGGVCAYIVTRRLDKITTNTTISDTVPRIDPRTRLMALTTAKVKGTIFGELVQGKGCAKPELKSTRELTGDIAHGLRNCQIWCESLYLARGKCCEWHPKETRCAIFGGGVISWNNHYAAARSSDETTAGAPTTTPPNLAWNNIKSRYCDNPSSRMSSNNLNDAKQECHNNLSCIMFYDYCSKGSEFSFCTDSSTEMSSGCGSTLYRNYNRGGIQCAPWPAKSQRNSCGGSGIWTALDTGMAISKTEECEALCKRQNVKGCCYLGARTGCYWNKDGNSIRHFGEGNGGEDLSEDATSIDCSKACKTILGDPCVFPFSYKNVEYTACTSVENNGTQWCSTEVDGNGVVIEKKWGNCGPECNRGSGKILKKEHHQKPSPPNM